MSKREIAHWVVTGLLAVGLIAVWRTASNAEDVAWNAYNEVDRTEQDYWSLELEIEQLKRKTDDTDRRLKSMMYDF